MRPVHRGDPTPGPAMRGRRSGVSPVDPLSQDGHILRESSRRSGAMDPDRAGIDDALYRSIQDDLVDSFGAGLEMEVDDQIRDAKSRETRSRGRCTFARFTRRRRRLTAAGAR